MLLERFESFTRLDLALAASWALAAGVGATIPGLAVVLTTFLGPASAGAEAATSARLAVRLAAVLTRVFLTASLLAAGAFLVVAFTAVAFTAVAFTGVALAGAALTAGLAGAAFTGVAFFAAWIDLALATLLTVFLTPRSSVLADCRATRAEAVRSLGVSFLADASTVAVVAATANRA